MTADGFARWLRGWPDDRLVELVALRVGRAHRLPTSFEQLGGLLAHPAALEPALERLDRTAVQVAVALADAGGCLTAAELAQRLARPHGLVDDALRRAGALALVWPDGTAWRAADGLAAGAGRVLGRRGRLAPEVDDPPPRTDVPPADPPVAAAMALVSRAAELLAALTPAPRARASGGLGVPVLRRLARTTGAPLDDVVLLLQLLGAAGLVGTGPQAGTVTAAGRGWLQLPEEQAHARLVAPQLHPRAVLEPVGSEPSGVLQGVARTGYGPWTLRGLAEAVVARGPESDASLLAWLDWSRWRPGSRLERLDDLRPLVAVLDLLGLRGDGAAAPWLPALLAVEPSGLLDAAAGEEVAAAAAVLEHHLPPPQEQVVLQADGTAFVAGRAADGLRRLLDLLGRRESEHTWRLSAAGVRTALDAGRTGPDLLDELRQRCRHALPAAVEQLVLDGARGHGRVRVLAATTVLRLDDPLLAVELLHDRRLKALALTEVAPGVLASNRTPEQVVEALRAAGHAPAGDGTAPPRTPPAPRVRTARPVVQQRSWGHDAEQVVAALRAAPPAPPPPPAGRGAHRDDPRGLLGRLSHLSPGERVLLRRAVSSGGPVEIEYVDAAGASTTRVVEGLSDTGHLLVGWCRLREDERTFAPAGILAVHPAP